MGGISRASPGSGDLDAEALDHRVGEQLARHLLGSRFRLGGIGLGEVELDHLARADILDPAEAEPGRSAMVTSFTPDSRRFCACA